MLFSQAPSNSELQALGMDACDVAEKTCVVWPDCWPAVDAFLRCQTQWRTTAAGVIGLDYGVVLAVLKELGATDVLVALDDVRVIESRALKEINRGNKG